MKTINPDYLYSPNEMEAEANYFALCLLMPEEQFLIACHLWKNDMDKLSKLFGVPRTAVAARMDSLFGIT